MSQAGDASMAEDGAHGPEFAIQRIYVKDSSFESPESPSIFREQWEPKVNIDLQTSSNLLEGDVYEVVLGVTVTVKIKEKTAFLAETKQAGIFSIGQFNDEQRNQLLGSFCPNILFPYARETITSLVTRGGFPQLYLAPINFDAVYQQQMKQHQEGETAN